MSDTGGIGKLRALLETGEQLMNGGKRALDLGSLAASRVKLGMCASCGNEEAIEGLPLGPDCAKRSVSSVIDLLGRKSG